MQKQFVALGLTLKDCEFVKTLGVKPQFSDYSEEELRLLKRSPAVLFPTFKYVPIFDAVKKATFPSASSYYYKRSLHLQFSLASYLEIPHLKTRLFYGNKQKSNILSFFHLPLKIFTKRNNTRAFTIVTTEEELTRTISLNHSLIVQEVVNGESWVGLVLLNFKLIGFTTAETPSESVIKTSLKMCETANIDDILIKWVKDKGTWKFAGMEYPPKECITPQGIVARKEQLLSMLKGILTGQENPPWTRSYVTRI